MKRTLQIILSALVFTSSAFSSDNGENLEYAVYEMNNLHTVGPCGGCEDCVFKSVSASMIGWGIGLAAGIALITGLIHNSRAEDD